MNEPAHVIRRVGIRLIVLRRDQFVAVTRRDQKTRVTTRVQNGFQRQTGAAFVRKDQPMARRILVMSGTRRRKSSKPGA